MIEEMEVCNEIIRLCNSSNGMLRPMARTGTDSRTRPELSKAGIDAVWIPPVTKATSAEDNGYGVYDLYDLGEFDQKGTVRTKYGTKQELIDAIAACHKNGIAVYVDLVMNHKAGADETERFRVVQVDEMDRTKDISKPFEIEGWTKFTFSGRGDQYSSFQWNFTHFNGTDYDEVSKRSGIFRIVGENKSWSDNVDNEFGNYDYLMFANIDYSHPDVRKEMLAWGKWLVDTPQCADSGWMRSNISTMTSLKNLPLP